MTHQFNTVRRPCTPTADALKVDQWKPLMSKFMYRFGYRKLWCFHCTQHQHQHYSTLWLFFIPLSIAKDMAPCQRWSECRMHFGDLLHQIPNHNVCRSPSIPPCRHGLLATPGPPRKRTRGMLSPACVYPESVGWPRFWTTEGGIGWHDQVIHPTCCHACTQCSVHIYIYI